MDLGNFAGRFAAERERGGATGPAGRESKAAENNLSLLDTLAAAYAEAGRFQDAVRTAEEALQLAGGGKSALAESLRKRIKPYGAGQPWRDSPPPGPTKGR